jgi:FkbM family methyltransferase
LLYSLYRRPSRHTPVSSRRSFYRRLRDRVSLVPRLIAEQSARLQEISSRVDRLAERLHEHTATLTRLEKHLDALYCLEEALVSPGNAATTTADRAAAPPEPNDADQRDDFWRLRLMNLLAHRSMLTEARDRVVDVPAGTIPPADGAGAEVSCWLFWGDRLRFEAGDWIGEQLRRDHFTEVGLTQFIIQYLDRHAVFFDVGAHLGYYSLLASKLLASASQIHAFEPTDKVFRVLERNCRHLEGIHLNNTAVWSATQDIAFTELGNIFSAFNSALSPRLTELHLKHTTPTLRTVPAESLDDYCVRTGVVPGFVKIDVESAEMKVLQGMKGLLTDAPPIVTLEVGDFDIPDVPPSCLLVQTMLKAGYRALQYSEGAIRPHTPRERYEYDNILFLPPGR